MKLYVGERAADGEAKVYVLDGSGEKLVLPPRYDLANHSPDGFEWGYGGSGPAQLSLALLADATGFDEIALKLYQRFNQCIVAGLPRVWALEQQVVTAWANVFNKESVDSEAEALIAWMSGLIAGLTYGNRKPWEALNRAGRKG